MRAPEKAHAASRGAVSLCSATSEPFSAGPAPTSRSRRRDAASSGRDRPLTRWDRSLTRRLGLAVLALVLVTSAAHAADVVRLKDGRVLRGRVDDRGAYVLVTTDGANGMQATLRIARSDVLSIALDGQKKRTRDALDVVVLLSGDEIAGRVELREDGAQVAVISGSKEASGEILLDRRQVREILWSQRSESELKKADGGGIGRTVERLLQTYEKGEGDERKAARRSLLDLGIFALPYLEVRKGRVSSPEVQALVGFVLEVARVRAHLTAFLLDRFPNLARRVLAPTPELRLLALKDAILARSEDCVPLLVYRASREPSTEVRAFILAQLSLMNRLEELAGLLKSRDPRLRFAAALALGDNGLYVGVPLVVEGLKHKEAAVRRVSLRALKRWTGRSFGYFATDLQGKAPKAQAKKRAAAVARWEAWLASAEGKQLIDRSVRATVRRDLVSKEDKERGQALWMEAQLLWGEALDKGLGGEARKDAFQAVRFKLLQALDAYPHFVPCRLALAELDYTELGDLKQAREQLEILLRRYAADGGRRVKPVIYLHLGQVARLERQWDRARGHLRVARGLTPNDYRIRRALAELDFDQAIQDPTLDAKKRREKLMSSLREVDGAIGAVRVYRRDVKEAEKAADAVATEDSPFAGGRFRTGIRSTRRQLTREEAGLHFLAGRSLSALHKDEQAFKAYRKARELAPQNPMYIAAENIWRTRAKQGAAAPASDAAPKPKPTRAKKASSSGDGEGDGGGSR